ncbi:hypothetical protein C8F04DRAFT_1066300 [Mycena alexandri]|uniref:DUF6533 domain-containing protein n=1 Tax=Mycena alexandri TaxID=1745969 RepID=A0AAD6TGU4_9AGAR|nr:hypothetical protein C8F04DRAFT_1066300 [Mycena alexandri]
MLKNCSSSFAHPIWSFSSPPFILDVPPLGWSFMDALNGIPPALLNDITITRYVNAAAYVILLYDHLLSLGSEVNLIWPAKNTSAKWLFLFIRYTIPCAITVYTVQLSGLSNIQLSSNFCVWWMSCAAFIGWATVATSNFLILLRLWVIWERNRKLMLWTLGCFLFAQTGGLACAAILVHAMKPQLTWNTELQMCAFIGQAPPVAILWAPGTAFEIVLCAITWWNALNRPRSSNNPLAAAIYRDGFLYFLLLLCLRIINTVLAVAAPRGLIFVAMFPVLCGTTTTTCRLVITLRQVAADHTIPDDRSVDVEEYDQLEQSGVHVEMLRSVGPSTPIRGGW